MRTARTLIALLTLLTAAACTDDRGVDDDAPARTSGSASATSDVIPKADDITGPDAGNATLPKTGLCWSMTAEQLDDALALTSTDQQSVDCSTEHNAITAGVVGIPTQQLGSVAALAETGQAIDPGHEQIWRSVVTPACAAAHAKAFASGTVDTGSGDVELAYKSSNLRPYAWLPTGEEWAGGARWIRCDIANRFAAPVPIEKPAVDLSTVADDQIACLNATSEGYLPMPCDNPQVNAQSLVTVVLTQQAADAAKAGYDAFTSGQTPQLCQQAVSAAFPAAGKPAKAATPVAFAFTGTFDCYVDRAAGEPFVQ
ncbi:hypothetical protein [Cumulibacter manganitolerans]|uniref:hypothetical protein n=1 Tax=Cumulibacter manganitolerans TaxID=1884992 RepID=UPI00129653A6|nr:hypothetical protein [Cumulibacter manganitolerans]